MDYKLFDDYITLQALLKETGIIPSGGAAKAFLKDHSVLLNGQAEDRRGKKLRLGDRILLEDPGVTIHMVQPSPEEIAEHQEEVAEKKRVAQLVKAMNKDVKKAKKGSNQNKPATSRSKKQGPVRFPGR